MAKKKEAEEIRVEDEVVEETPAPEEAEEPTGAVEEGSMLMDPPVMFEDRAIVVEDLSCTVFVEMLKEHDSAIENLGIDAVRRLARRAREICGFAVDEIYDYEE